MPIETRNLSHIYLAGTARAVRALDEVSLHIADGEAVGVMGATGSGKSTLVQHFNGLLRPSSGQVLVDGRDLWAADASEGPGRHSGGRRGRRRRRARSDLRWVRQKVGLIFQFPEQQLFEETVFDDVAFGPRNLGLGEDEVEERVHQSLARVGLDSDEARELGRRSPFTLSGGQMRRVAIAGVLAMRPAVLVLDEPTAGLDPQGRRDLLAALRRLHDTQRITLVVVSHHMEDLAALARRLIVLERGHVVLDGPAEHVFGQSDRLAALGLEAPATVALLQSLVERGAEVDAAALDPSAAAAELDRWLRAGRPGLPGGAQGRCAPV